MSVETEDIELDTTGEVQILDLKERLESIVQRSGINTGTIHCFIPGATGALTYIEYEPGLLEDLPALLDRIIPKGIEYAHDRTWNDGNGHSHLRTSLIGSDITMPIRKGRIVLGTWQHPVFIELDVRPRKRRILVTLMGE